MREINTEDKFQAPNNKTVWVFSDLLLLDTEELEQEGIILNGEKLDKGEFKIECFTPGIVPTLTRSYGIVKLKGEAKPS